MKKIIVSGYIGFNNFGDEVIFKALLTHLKKMGHKVSVFCKNKKQNDYDAIKYNFKCPFDILKGIISNDILISGGGSLLQNKTSNFSLIYYLSIIFLAKLFFKKVIIFAQGIEPIKGKFFEKLLVFVLKKVDLITVRDEKSKKYLESLNLKEIVLLSDPIYAYLNDKKVNNQKEGLLVQLRSFNGIDDKFLDDLASSISKSYKSNVNVLSLQDSFDKDICHKFCQKLENNGLKATLLYSKTIDEIIEILNNSLFVISTRLHGILVANAFYSRVFALCYDDKIKTVIDEFNLQNIDIFNYTKEELDKKIDEYLNSNINEVHHHRLFDWDIIDKTINKGK